MVVVVVPTTPVVVEGDTASSHHGHRLLPVLRMSQAQSEPVVVVETVEQARAAREVAGQAASRLAQHRGTQVEVHQEVIQGHAGHPAVLVERPVRVITPQRVEAITPTGTTIPATRTTATRTTAIRTTATRTTATRTVVLPTSTETVHRPVTTRAIRRVIRRATKPAIRRVPTVVTTPVVEVEEPMRAVHQLLHRGRHLMSVVRAVQAVERTAFVVATVVVEVERKEPVPTGQLLDPDRSSELVVKAGLVRVSQVA